MPKEKKKSKNNNNNKTKQSKLKNSPKEICVIEKSFKRYIGWRQMYIYIYMLQFFKLFVFYKGAN